MCVLCVCTYSCVCVCVRTLHALDTGVTDVCIHTYLYVCVCFVCLHMFCPCVCVCVGTMHDTGVFSKICCCIFHECKHILCVYTMHTLRNTHMYSNRTPCTLYTRICIHIFMCLCLCVSVYACRMHALNVGNTYVYVCVCVCICVCICVCVCVSIGCALSIWDGRCIHFFYYLSACACTARFQNSDDDMDIYVCVRAPRSQHGFDMCIYLCVCVQYLCVCVHIFVCVRVCRMLRGLGFRI